MSPFLLVLFVSCPSREKRGFVSVQLAHLPCASARRVKPIRRYLPWIFALGVHTRVSA